MGAKSNRITIVYLGNKVKIARTRLKELARENEKRRRKIYSRKWTACKLKKKAKKKASKIIKEKRKYFGKYIGEIGKKKKRQD